MASCKFEILVSAYLDGELSEEERELFERHVQGCETCRDLVAQWREVEQALRRQRLRQALRDEGETAEQVLRELSRSGEFRRARRKSAWRRGRDHVAAAWRTYALGLCVLVVAALVVWGLGRPSHRGVGAVGDPTMAAALPSLSDTLGQARAVLTDLVGPVGSQPGAGRRLQARLVESDLLTRLAWHQARLIAGGELRDGLDRVETALVLLANLSEDHADAEAAALAEAVRQSKLLDEVGRLINRTAAETY